jgi:hypothetical protein
MPQVDWDSTPDANDYSPLPDGTYRVTVEEVEEKQTSSGDLWWNLELRVIHGDCAGKKFWDGIFFTEKAMPRVKLVCSRLGLKVHGVVDLTPDMLVGKVAYVNVIQEDYIDKEGNTRTKNSVPFGGYTKINDDEKEDDDDMPF